MTANPTEVVPRSKPQMRITCPALRSPLHSGRAYVIYENVAKRGAVAYRKQSVSVVLRGLGDPKTRLPPNFTCPSVETGMCHF
jgi:hypothetical protein